MSASPQLHYGCTALLGTNKAGILKPDANGRYKLVLGALEYPNSVGDIYTLRSAQQFFKEGTSLMRRIKDGYLKSELGHPKRLPGMTDRDYMERILTIEETNVSAHISDVWIDMNSVKDKDTGKSIICFIGNVAPAGPHAQQLRDSLNDPLQNVAFSVRSLTLNRQVGFRQHKDFTQIINWDQVTEPGLKPANKYMSPALECYQDTVFSHETMMAIINDASDISFESAALIREAYDFMRGNSPIVSLW